MARFKLLRGVHSEGGVTHEPGAVFDSRSNLLELNHAANAPRFELVDLPKSDPQETAKAAQAGYDTINELQPKKDGLDEMTVEQLRQFAAESEVDLGKARTKDQILAVLRSA